MSTNINITVDNNNLAGAAKTLQQAARQSQQQKETEKKLEEKATAERIKVQATQGRDANGNQTIVGAPFAQPQAQSGRRPAANRQPKPILGLAWWKYEAENINTITVYTGDKKESLTIQLDYAGSNASVIRWWICLPAGDGSMILVFYTYAFNEIPANDGRPMSIEGDYDDTSGGPAMVELIEEMRALHACLGYGGIIGSVSPSCTIVELEGASWFRVLHRFIDIPYLPFLEGSPGSGAVSAVFKQKYHCFHVTEKTVRAIQLPNAFEAMLKQKMPVLDLLKTTVEYFQYGIRYYLARATLARPDGSFFRHDRSSVHVEEYKVTRTLTSFSPYHVSNTGDYLDDSLIVRSYGYGDLLHPVSDQDPAWGTTPSIYSYFSAANTDPEDLIDNATYSIVRDLIGDGAPRKGLTLGYQQPETEVNTTKEYFYFNLPPADIGSDDEDSYFSSSNPALNLKRVWKVGRNRGLPPDPLNEFGASAPDFPDNLRPVVAWDWDNPSYCRRQLTRLGFNTANLAQ